MLKEDALNQMVDVKPIIASNDKDEIYDQLEEMPKDKTFATFYTGKIKGIFALTHGFTSI